MTSLGVTYVSLKSPEGGDLHLTRFGLQVHEHLRIENWFADDWFVNHRVPLEGTSSVFRVQTRKVQGKSLDLVVKNCRVGEDVPVDTHTLKTALGMEFNSPWEEFSLVMELREGPHGPENDPICTQRPLAIYVPPDFMQLWQSGRSRAKINRILAAHPGIDLDILRQYKLIYEWVPGQDVVEILKRAGIWGSNCDRIALEANRRVVADLASKGYWVGDMKPQHIIVTDADVATVIGGAHGAPPSNLQDRLCQLLDERRYWLVDYELLLRTPEHELEVRQARRQNYLAELERAEEASVLPSHLSCANILGVNYIEGTVQSTGGQLFIVGKNHRLFDFFLPERWRKTALWRLAKNTELAYTITKDDVYVLWTPSRVGEPMHKGDAPETARYLSPFEVFAFLTELAACGVPVVAPRAIYETGTAKSEVSQTFTAYEQLADERLPNGSHVLREDRNYLMIFGMRAWFREPLAHDSIANPPRPVGLTSACESSLVSTEEALAGLNRIQALISAAGFDGSLVTTDDLLVTLDEHDQVHYLEPGFPDVRLHGAELLARQLR